MLGRKSSIRSTVGPRAAVKFNVDFFPRIFAIFLALFHAQVVSSCHTNLKAFLR